MKQTKMTAKQENKGMNGILDLTSQLSQILKQFIGIYDKKLPDCDGMTVEDWMAAHGVPRFVGKNGKKGGYTPALVNGGWNDNMLLKSDEGKVMSNCIYKNVTALMTISEDDKDAKYKVYTKEEAEKVDGQPIKLYKLCQIPENKWSVRTMLKGLKQSEHYDKEAEKALKSAEAWAKIAEEKNCYIVKTEKQDDKIVRKVIRVSPDRVEF